MRINRRTLAASAAALAATSVVGRSVSAQATPVGTPDPAVTGSPAGLQLQWIIGVINGDEPFPTAADLSAKFSADFLAAVPADQMVSIFTQLKTVAPVKIDGIVGIPTSLSLDALSSDKDGNQVIITITVEEAEPHLISGLLFQPYTDATPEPVAPLADWAALETVLSNAGPQYSVYAAEVMGDGTLSEIHQSSSNPVLAIGSTFKLYVLGALAKTVIDGKVSWTDTVEVTDALKSLPSGVTQNEAVGTKLSVKELADRMISISDNTATDMLLVYVGRPACEAQLEILGNSDPARTMPMLKTRELFILKLDNRMELVAKYLAGNVDVKRRVLEEIAGNPLPPLSAAASWTTPILIDSLEWFATTADLAGAMNALWKQGETDGLSELHDILTINPGVPLDSATWSNVAYKGGSEPGVLALTWRAERADGRVFVFSCGVNNGGAVLPETDIINAATGAFALLASA